MSRTYDRLKELEKRTGNPANGELAPKGFHVAQVNRVQNLQEKAERLRQTVATLEAAMEDFNKENVELATQLEESRKRARLLHQEVAASDQKLQEINQTHEKSVKELEREIKEKAKEMENLRTEYLQNVRMLQEQVVQRDCEVQNLRNETEGLGRTIATLEAAGKEIQKLWVRYKQQLRERR